jgi:hypothetical protein
MWRSNLSQVARAADALGFAGVLGPVDAVPDRPVPAAPATDAGGGLVAAPLATAHAITGTSQRSDRCAQRTRRRRDAGRAVAAEPVDERDRQARYYHRHTGTGGPSGTSEGA